jgi:hypothetical protein
MLLQDSVINYDIKFYVPNQQIHYASKLVLVVKGLPRMWNVTPECYAEICLGRYFSYLFNEHCTVSSYAKQTLQHMQHC